MTVEEAKQSVGTMVMSSDPGHKMVRSLAFHGPYKLLSVTKAGLCILEGRQEFRIPPRNIKKA